MWEGKEREKAWSQGKIKRPPQRRRRKDALAPAERRRLAQLVVCLALFAALFLGQGLPLGPLSRAGDQLAALIHQNTDFKSAFLKMGRSVSEGEPFVETFGTLWTAVIGMEEAGGAAEDPAGAMTPENPAEISGPFYPLPEGNAAPPQDEPAAPAEAEAAPEEAAAETVTPVMGILTSGFGYRNHPLDGEWKEHQGVDIEADAGTPILAYAAGEVDYVGESEAYGLYLQLRHSDGTTTFYAHCSDICVRQGQQVAAGEKIGEVGATGNTTGPHLHFEMKRDGVRVDPLDYIETLAS